MGLTNISTNIEARWGPIGKLAYELLNNTVGPWVDIILAIWEKIVAIFGPPSLPANVVQY